jgi:hypothetical protein
VSQLQQTIDWLQALAHRGGKGVVDNIDARCLGRVAVRLDKMRKALKPFADKVNGDATCDLTEELSTSDYFAAHQALKDYASG